MKRTPLSYPHAPALAACLLLCLLSACPAKPKDSGEPGGVKGPEPPAGYPNTGQTGSKEPATGTATSSYQPEALDYLLSGIEKAGDPQYPNLGQVWQSLAVLPGLAASQDAKAALLRAAIGKAVTDAGDRPPPELVRAWLSTQPDLAADWIAQGFAKANGRYLTAITEHEADGRLLLDKLDGAKLSPADCGIALDVLRTWGSATPGELPLLRGLASQTDKSIKLRATGWLLKLKDEPEKNHKLLWDSVRNAGKDISALAAAAEGVRISGDGTLSDAFAPLLADVKLGQETVGTSAPTQQVYSAYAISFLPGPGPAVVNKRLLGAVSPRLCWQAALGQLLAGDSSAWDARIKALGPGTHEMWVALASPEALSPLLLPTYEAAASSQEQKVRGQAAQQLNRYSAFAADKDSGPRMAALLVKLGGDSDKAVASQAYFSAGMLQLSGLEDSARKLLADPKAPVSLRWAACTYLLRLSEARPQ